MGEYDDFGMGPRGRTEMVAGVCHSRGENADLPPVWLMYIVVKNLKQSIESCQRLGGSLIAPPRPLGKGQMCVISDLAGAMVALYEEPGKRRRSSPPPQER